MLDHHVLPYPPTLESFNFLVLMNFSILDAGILILDQIYDVLIEHGGLPMSFLLLSTCIAYRILVSDPGTLGL